MCLLATFPLALASGAALLLAPSASAQIEAPPDSLFEPLRPGESVFMYMESGPESQKPAVEALFYLWQETLGHAYETTAALDSVVAAAPETVGTDGWSADERAAFRRAFVRTAVAAAAGRSQVEYATEFTLRLTPETTRERVSALLNNRTNWLRERLIGMADLAAAVALCPDSPEDAFRACFLRQDMDLDEPVPWQSVRDDLEAAADTLAQALTGDEDQ